MSESLEKMCEAFVKATSEAGAPTHGEWWPLHNEIKERFRAGMRAVIATMAANVSDAQVIACASAPRDPSLPKIEQMRAGIAAAITAIRHEPEKNQDQSS